MRCEDQGSTETDFHWLVDQVQGIFATGDYNGHIDIGAKLSKKIATTIQESPS